MIIPFVVLAGIALTAACLVGWLVCDRSTQPLRAQLVELQQRVVDAEAHAIALVERDQLREGSLAGLRASLAAAEGRAAEATSTHAGLHAEAAALRRSLAEADGRATDAVVAHAALQAEVESLRERLRADRETGVAREGRAMQTVARVLAPLMERERIGGELAGLELGPGTRGELPRLMDAIASIGKFSSVVLSDEVGLPLAVNRGSEDGEMHAALWSMLIAIADRSAACGAPVPTALVVHDSANQTLLHRLFSAGGSRFLLTAVCRGRSLPAEALDPALDKIERLLAGSALARVA